LQKKAASPAPMQPFAGVASGLTTPSGLAAASCAWACVIMPWTAIWLMTSLRRPTAAWGCATGSNAAVDCTIPASNAAWGMVRRSGVVLKYVRDAAPMP
jgi:hypothetical protein